MLPRKVEKVLDMKTGVRPFIVEAYVKGPVLDRHIEADSLEGSVGVANLKLFVAFGNKEDAYVLASYDREELNSFLIVRDTPEGAV